MIKLDTETLEAYQSNDGLNDTELALKMGMNRTQIWRVKEGYNEPGKNFIAGVLKVFPDASFDDLFFIPGASRPRNIKEQTA